MGDFLEENGMRRYEISNYALEGFECQHNLVYWNYGNYLGVGPAAHGRIRSDLNFTRNCSKESVEDSGVISSFISENLRKSKKECLQQKK